MSQAEQDAPFFVTPRKNLWQHIMCRWADSMESGQILLQFPDGREHVARGTARGPSAQLRLHNSRPFFRLLTGGSLGFSKSYVDGDWDTPDIGAVLELALSNETSWRSLLAASRAVGRLAYLRHCLRRNSPSGSRRNIAFHYDLGNDFYREWLDDTMTYSSALYAHPDQPLAEAQAAKYERIIRELKIGPDDHVLEIGCGWGGFMEHAIRQTGCRATGLTLSLEQANYARERLRRSGLSAKAEVRLQDYRDCGGQFTKIVSIEMFEAVGEENWPIYFNRLRELLAPEGRAMIQVITIAEDRFDHYRRNADFIQTYIFPGGMLPSPTVFREKADASGLRVRDLLRFGTHYDRTLMAWEQAFVAKWQRIRALGFDERFHRMWRYYLHYCAIGFRLGRIDVVQFHLSRD
ncbi:cyclopropane-fatty-acyl-phospholipid synthase family protein [Sinorhizobium sp. BG8]|uniref:SAM-dependent methyltransferase n=1 Tax=Sinorhizobium sp. BG8 TaxID=2613773 RepID=UPI00193C9340|nr:cyclopropane-fatty-acyl-phospholipid synthase family protein [Sinorhizobium sp. BG8]QRM57538.1 class I SAM-dependent methyltransferase [Sinorhizobium sp. BG8]